MARPSTNTDTKLIRSGVKLLKKKGVAGLVLRDVAKDARVNLGMFNYHFKNKDDFSRAVLRSFYEDFFTNFESCLSEAVQNPTHISHLEKALLKVAEYILANAESFSILVKDFLNGEKLVVDFASTQGYRHVELMFKLVQDCQKNGVIRKDIPPQQILFMIATNAGVASAIGYRLQTVFPSPVKKIIQNEILNIENIKLRLNVIIEGLKP
jgi:AcrR family transcriptional regulator